MFRLTSTLPVAAAVIAAAALAACGSNSPPSSSTSGSARRHTYAQALQEDVRFAGCMRAHGVGNFANPTSPYELKHWLISSAARLPVAASAETACQHLLPGGGGPPQDAAPSQARITAGRAFARCMRSHGFPSFPDPNDQGQLTPQMVTAVGIDLHQPAMLRAGLDCVPQTHGLLKPADIERAVNGG